MVGITTPSPVCAYHASLVEWKPHEGDSLRWKLDDSCGEASHSTTKKASPLPTA